MNSPNPPEGPYPIPPDDVELLKKYRDIVMPAARLAGYDDFAKWLFTIAAVIGTLGAAFSNAALKGLGGAGVTVFFLAIVATAISLALAVIQRSVDIPKLNWHDLDDMLKKGSSIASQTRNGLDRRHILCRRDYPRRTCPPSNCSNRPSRNKKFADLFLWEGWHPRNR